LPGFSRPPVMGGSHHNAQGVRNGVDIVRSSRRRGAVREEEGRISKSPPSGTHTSGGSSRKMNPIKGETLSPFKNVTTTLRA